MECPKIMFLLYTNKISFSCGLRTAGLSSLKRWAKELYAKYRGLVDVRDHISPPKDFDQRCAEFSASLGNVFEAAPRPPTELTPEEEECFQSLRVSNFNMKKGFKRISIVRQSDSGLESGVLFTH